MAKIRGLIVDPTSRSIRETMISSTPRGCSLAVGGYLRFGTWIGRHDALYLSGHPEIEDAFTVAERMVFGIGLILGAGSGRRGLKTPASISPTEVEALVRFNDFPDGCEPLNAAVAVDRTAPFEWRHPTTFRKPR